MKHCESPEAERKPAARNRPSQLLVATASRWIRGLLLRQVVLLWSTRDRTPQETLQSAQTPLFGAWQASSTLKVCRTPFWAKKLMRTISRGWPPVTATRHGKQPSLSIFLRSLLGTRGVAHVTQSCYEQSGSRICFETPVLGDVQCGEK